MEKTVSIAVLIIGLSVHLYAESEILSPKIVKTKYGSLRGIIIEPKTTGPRKTPNYNGTGDGKLRDSIENQKKVPEFGKVEVFLGVPYGSPPLGSLRFMPPVTPSHWRGVKIVDKLAPVCPQKLPKTKVPWTFGAIKRNEDNKDTDFASETQNTRNKSSNFLPKGRVEFLKRILPYLTNQSEDCLYLNIYAPYNPGEYRSFVTISFVIQRPSSICPT